MTSITEYAPIAIFSFLVIIGTIAFTMKQQDALETKLAKETSDIVADRVAANIKALHSYPRGSVEMDLRRAYKVDIKQMGMTNDGPIYQVNMTYAGESGLANFTTSLGVETEDSNTPSWMLGDEDQMPDIISADQRYPKLCLVKTDAAIQFRGGAC